MIQQCIDLIKTHYPEIKLIYLFGSQAKGCSTANSDWDIALLNDRKLDPLKRWQLSEELAELLNSDVDLVDLLEASTVLQMQVITQGKLLFERDNFAASFEMQIFSMYGRLQEDRRDIIEHFIKENKK